MKIMINVTISILLLCGLCSLMNCKACSNKSFGKNQTGITQIDTVKLSMNVDSVKVATNFWGCGYRSSFILYISDSGIKKADYFNEDDVTAINSIDIKNKLIDYINKFFIDKTEKVIENKKKRGYVVSTDYPTIKVTGFHLNKEIFNNKIRIGDDTYDIVYNPEFLKFYELLDSMAMTK